MNLAAALALSDIERTARAHMDRAVWAYVAGGAGSARTIRGNAAAFDAVWLRPRLARTAAHGAPDLRVTLFGRTLALPILLAPTSPQRLVHEDAELATARAGKAAGTISIVSTDSHYPFPAIAAAGDGCWFQLYAYQSRRTIEATIDMAVEAGASAIVVTVDACYAARRIAAKRAGFRTPPYVDFGTLRSLGILTGDAPPDGRIERLQLTWEDLAWIRGRTPIPLLIKGVLDPADARRCVDVGADGVVVSNHGGRQLDAVVPSLIALEQVAPIVRDQCVVLVDGGVRSGIDVIKAIGLGAHAVCIGRPYLWGLAIDGQAGVEAVLAILRREVEDTLLQLGLSSVADVDAQCLAGMRWLPRMRGHEGRARHTGDAACDEREGSELWDRQAIAR